MAIYFIQNTRSKNIKIGASDDPAKRLGALQVSNDAPLRIVGIMPGGYVEEAELHRRFSGQRLRGEWFRYSAGLMREIDRVCVGGLSLNVWDECLLRDRCRYGLTNIPMRHVPTDREFICGGSEWGEGEVLFVFMSEGWYDPGHEPQYGEFGEICLADIDLDHYHFPEKVPATECVLRASWPIVCCSRDKRR